MDPLHLQSFHHSSDIADQCRQIVAVLRLTGSAEPTASQAVDVMVVRQARPLCRMIALFSTASVNT